MATNSGAPANPFDAPGQFLVLANDRADVSLWPLFADVPEGWHAVHGPVERHDALDWITRRAAEAPTP
ncbi:MbtH family NRPS accessory protein [Streptomyces sp. NPDC001941]|uniref:MbtH family NRPS accessory protein n=1 Tax=Streptomyces sp. NPDC001941 TaxID=3154659 RepID=UPI00333494EF